MNISNFSDQKTANTNIVSAKQRAAYLNSIHAHNIMKLCVGPSLKRLQAVYANYGISCWGNDIDSRWKEYYPQGHWMIGDALRLVQKLQRFDTIVFAPPLSKGCSGRREDSLYLKDVSPGYKEFLQAYKQYIGVKNLVLVLPGKTLSIKSEKNEMYKLLSCINVPYQIIPLTNVCVKYIDILIPKVNS